MPAKHPERFAVAKRWNFCNSLSFLTVPAIDHCTPILWRDP
jgi:hypothetical protein